MRTMRRSGDLEGGTRKLVLGSQRRNTKAENWRTRSEAGTKEGRTAEDSVFAEAQE